MYTFSAMDLYSRLKCSSQNVHSQKEAWKEFFSTALSHRKLYGCFQQIHVHLDC